MTDLVLHPATERRLVAFSTRPSHGLLLTGAPGSGKSALARDLAARLLETEAERLTLHPYARLIGEDGKPIGIDIVRQLERFLSLTVPGRQAIKRLVVLEGAERLTTEAQNALLKTLEEPPLDTVLILTAAHPEQLLATVRSRLTTLPVLPPGKTPLMTHFSRQGAAKPALDAAYAISGGLPGLMSALLAAQDHPLQPAIAEARYLLQAPLHGRLLRVDELSKQRDLLADTLFVLKQMADIGLRSTNGPKLQRWQNVLKASYSAAQALDENAQTKLVAINLMLNLN